MTLQEAEALNEAIRIILSRNLESKLTVDLASGMYTSITTAVVGFIQPEKAEDDTK
jgi:hypothetical protein